MCATIVVACMHAWVLAATDTAAHANERAATGPHNVKHMGNVGAAVPVLHLTALQQANGLLKQQLRRLQHQHTGQRQAAVMQATTAAADMAVANVNNSSVEAGTLRAGMSRLQDPKPVNESTAAAAGNMGVVGAAAAAAAAAMGARHASSSNTDTRGPLPRTRRTHLGPGDGRVTLRPYVFAIGPGSTGTQTITHLLKHHFGWLPRFFHAATSCAGNVNDATSYVGNVNDATSYVGNVNDARSCGGNANDISVLGGNRPTSSLYIRLW